MRLERKILCTTLTVLLAALTGVRAGAEGVSEIPSGRGMPRASNESVAALKRSIAEVEREFESATVSETERLIFRAAIAVFKTLGDDPNATQAQVNAALSGLSKTLEDFKTARAAEGAGSMATHLDGGEGGRNSEPAEPAGAKAANDALAKAQADAKAANDALAREKAASAAAKKAADDALAKIEREHAAALAEEKASYEAARASAEAERDAARAETEKVIAAQAPHTGFFSVLSGAFFHTDFRRETITPDDRGAGGDITTYGDGAFLGLDFTYLELSAGAAGSRTAGAAQGDDSASLSYGFSLLFKGPVPLGRFAFTPLLGAEYILAADNTDKNQFWLNAGVGVDFALARGWFVRSEALYGIRLKTAEEYSTAQSWADRGYTETLNLFGGLNVRAALGYRF